MGNRSGDPLDGNRRRLTPPSGTIGRSGSGVRVGMQTLRVSVRGRRASRASSVASVPLGAGALVTGRRGPLVCSVTYRCGASHSYIACTEV